MKYIKLLLISLLMPLLIIASQNSKHTRIIKEAKKDLMYSSLKYDPCIRKKENYCDSDSQSSHECIKCVHHRWRNPYFREIVPPRQIALRIKTSKRIHKVISLTEQYRKIVGVDCEYQYPIERFFMYHFYVKPKHIYDFLVNNKIAPEELKNFKKKYFGEWGWYIKYRHRENKSFASLQKIASEMLAQRD